MLFYEKLNLLMKTQGVTNIKLGEALSVDPSLISRWRTGKRLPSGSTDYINNIADFFCRHSKKDYQKAAIYEIIGASPDKKNDTDSFNETLFQWLTEDKRLGVRLVNNFLGQLDASHKTGNSIPIPAINRDVNTMVLQEVEVLHGISGKKEGVLRILTALISYAKPCTILLYDDDDMGWLTEEKSYTMKLSILVLNVISMGYRIKIIHTIQREFPEMLSAINQWMPLYMTGAVDSYYCPKYRKSVFRHTMFIVPDIIAMASTSLADYTDNSEYFLYSDRNIIKNLVNEFQAFLSISRSLIKIFTKDKISQFNALQYEYHKQKGDVIFLSNTFSIVTFPPKLLESFLQRSHISKGEADSITAFQRNLFDIYNDNIFSIHFTEIITLPPPDVFKNGGYFTVNIMNNIAVHYTAQDICEHLENLITYLKKYEKYNLYIVSEGIFPDMVISVKEEAGVFIIKNDASPILFSINQPNMTIAFQCYLDDFIMKIPPVVRVKEYTISFIESYIKEVSDNNSITDNVNKEF